MATLDTIIEMQKQGMTDYEISSNLQSQGISPREINDGLNQAKIKSAISDTNITTQPQGIIPQNQPSFPRTNSQPQPFSQSQQFSQPQPSITQAEQGIEEEYPIQEQYPQEVYPQPVYPEEQYGTGQYPAEQYAGDQYSGGEYYAGQEGGGYTDTETITEIAEQVIAEKFKEYNKKTGDVSTFKTTIQDKVSNIEQRLKRIEDTIDKLQQAILSKIGEFGENTNMIKKDIENLHNTTSKLMNPLIDNYHELQKLNEKKHH